MLLAVFTQEDGAVSPSECPECSSRNLLVLGGDLSLQGSSCPRNLRVLAPTAFTAGMLQIESIKALECGGGRRRQKGMREGKQKGMQEKMQKRMEEKVLKVKQEGMQKEMQREMLERMQEVKQERMLEEMKEGMQEVKQEGMQRVTQEEILEGMQEGVMEV